MRRTALKRYTPLRRKTGLNSHTRLNPQSEKSKTESVTWGKVKGERIRALIEKFGYLICEYCNQPIILESPDAHHNNRNRRENVLKNARIVHRVCHSKIHDKNIKDTPSLL